MDSLYRSYRAKTDLKEKTNALLNYGTELLHNDIDSAFVCGEVALTHATQLKDSSLIADANVLIAFGAEAKGNYKAGLQHFLIATEIYKKKKNKTKLAKCYTGMGVIYWYQGFDTKAIDYYKKNITLCMELNDKGGLAAGYGNIAIIFDNNKDPENALLYYNKALAIFEEVKDMNQMAACLDNMSLVFKQQRNYKTALDYNIRGYRLRESIYDTIGMLASMENLGNIFIGLNKYDEAISISERVLSIASRLGAKEDMKFAYYNLKEAFEAKKDFKNANVVLNKLMDIKDSLRNIENANQIVELETKFKTKEKETELSEIKLIQQLREKENADALKKKNYSIIILSLSGLFILSLAFILLKRFREKKLIAEKFSAKNTAIEIQKTIIDKAYHQLSEKNKDITDSIKYAQRIQEALFPSAYHFANLFPQSFVYFKPKDIVSGDFYWGEKGTDGSVYAAVVDCTGHGVPGAFMSIVGFNLLNNAIHEYKWNTPADILNQVNKDLNETLKQREDENNIKDGMEVSICKWNASTNELLFAGANTVIYHVSQGILNTIKGDKHPIGSFYNEELKPFTTLKINAVKGDSIYLLSDGYADQFGGPKGKKFKYKPLEELLLKNSTLPPQQQLEAIDSTFLAWKNSLEQVDDVTIIGIQL